MNPPYGNPLWDRLRRSAWALSLAAAARLAAAPYVLIGWSEQGVKETDGTDVSVFSLAPPGNTIHAQLISNGLLVKSTNGVVVTYQAVADGAGSINTTSEGKANFDAYAKGMFGTALQPDQGLDGYSMPGPGNVPRSMSFDPAANVFTAAGIPLTPYDDQGRKNRLPMMRLIAKNAAGTTLATTDIALPVSDEMDCRACHASGSQSAARPAAGWAWECDPIMDYKLNILRYHDNARADWAVYTKALVEAGYNAQGLEATVVQDGQAVACLRCHPSNAMPGSGVSGMRPLTQLVHTKHSFVNDPVSGAALTMMTNSAACYLCHSSGGGLYERGAHRGSVAADGSLSMQCTSCHGSVGDVGTPGRQGWLDLPKCQSCHTGTATANSGALYYTNVFASAGVARLPADLTFATSTNLPTGTNGPSRPLFRTAVGHGGLQCAACHGAAHGEWDTAAVNDNVQSQNLQGHPGVLMDCLACHTTTPSSRSGGPHGMHLAGASWVSGHGDGAGRSAACQTCHGANSRGTELSWMGGARTMRGRLSGSAQFWKGFQVGCYTCHNGPGGGDTGGARLPVVTAAAATTVYGAPVTIPIQASGASGTTLTLRVVDQPASGRAVMVGNSAVYSPAPGFVGVDSFTVGAWDGSTDGNLATVQVTTTEGPCGLTAGAAVPTAAAPGTAVPFFGSGALTGCTNAMEFAWDFGDGAAGGGGAAVCHTYAAPGSYTWQLVTTGGGLSQTNSGAILISPTLGPPLVLTSLNLGYAVELDWPVDSVPVSVETSYDLSDPHGWTPLTDPPSFTATNASLQEFILPGQQFFRLVRVP